MNESFLSTVTPTSCPALDVADLPTTGPGNLAADWLVLSRVPSPKGSPPPLENGADLDPTNQPWRYATHRGSQRGRPLATGVSMEM